MTDSAPHFHTMLYRLIVLTGPLANQRITVTREPMNLGSAADCQLVLPDEEVAPKHALLEDRGEGGLHIRDLGTMHKILVNSREVRQSRLKHGDMVEIGRTRFLVQAVVAAVVEGGGRGTGERISPKLYLNAAAVLVLAVITWWRWPENHPDVLPPKAEPDLNVAASATNDTTASALSEATEPAPVPRRFTASDFSNAMASVVFPVSAARAGQTNPVATEIEKMRAELDAIHERIKTVTPPPVAAPEPPRFETSAPPVVVIAPAQPVLVVTTAPPPVANTPPPAPVHIAHNSQPPTNLPERPPAVAVTNIEPAIAAVPTAVAAPTGRVLRVLTVEQSRFPAGEDYDDMRNFNVILSLTDPRHEVANPEVSVDLTFYDEDLATGTVAPAASVQPVTALRPTQSWGGDRRTTISATYLLPKGARAKEKSAGHEARHYGYAVRVTYRGAVQDEWALPRSLLKTISAAQPTNAINSAQANIAP